MVTNTFIHKCIKLWCGRCSSPDTKDWGGAVLHFEYLNKLSVTVDVYSLLLWNNHMFTYSHAYSHIQVHVHIFTYMFTYSLLLSSSPTLCQAACATLYVHTYIYLCVYVCTAMMVKCWKDVYIYANIQSTIHVVHKCKHKDYTFMQTYRHLLFLKQKPHYCPSSLQQQQ